MNRVSRTAAAALGLLMSGCAGFDAAQPTLPGVGLPTRSNTPADVSGGLRDALAQGISTAVGTLGRPNGFWGNAAVRLPLPPPLARAEGTLRKLGMGGRVDEFQRALNQAAEQAAPYAADVFGSALRQMTLSDAQAILTGGEDAATQYFRRTSSPELTAKLRPYIEATTQRIGVTQKYKSLMGEHAALLSRAGMTDTDLDAYITAKAIDGLFYSIAAEEARIRRDPRARTTELMRQVFGSL